MKINLFNESAIKMRPITLAFLLCLIILIGCKKQTPIQSESLKAVDRTVLIYIAANNSLEYDAINSINQMEKATIPLNGNLIVFVKTDSKNSYLLKIKHDDSDALKSDTIKTYGNRNSSDPAFLKQVISDSRELSPAKSYSLVMWSHATSWAPPSEIKVKSFGYDQGIEMDIKDFKNAIPSDFTYIMFDACSMGSLEAIYEIKNKTKFILSSPSEVLSGSFPYEVITPSLFGDLDDLKYLSQKFIEYYESYTGLAASATVSLIDTKELCKLSLETKVLLNANKTNAGFNIDSIQKMDFEAASGVPSYDFLSSLEHNFNPDQYELVKAQLDKAVVFKAHTKNFFNIPIERFCGLSVYLPTKEDPYKNYYSTLDWSKASDWNRLF